MDQRNIVKCVEHRITLHEIFEDEHGVLPKWSDLRIECTVGSDICAQNEKFEVVSTLSVEEIKHNFGTKLISFERSSRESEVTALVQMVDTVAKTATKKAVNAYEVLMEGGREHVKKKTSR